MPGTARSKSCSRWSSALCSGAGSCCATRACARFCPGGASAALFSSESGGKRLQGGFHVRQPCTFEMGYNDTHVFEDSSEDLGIRSQVLDAKGAVGGDENARGAT